MKRLFFTLATIVLIINTVAGQDDFRKVETFNRNTWKWDEVAEKHKSATIQDGFLVLYVDKLYKTKKPLEITTRFPVNVQRNFKITYKVVFPALSQQTSTLGIIFNKTDYGKSVLKISENLFEIVNSDNSGKNIKTESKIKIPLKGGKDVPVTITIEKKGANLIFSVNGMKIYEAQKELQSSEWGFSLQSGKAKGGAMFMGGIIGQVISGDAKVMIDEIIIDQVEAEDN